MTMEGFRAISGHLDLLLHGLAITLVVSVLGILLAVALGSLLTLACAGPPATRTPARLFIELMRSLPFLLVLLLVHFGTLKFFGGAPAVVTGCIALALYASVYFAEAMRAALATVPRGQWEAAAALGLHRAIAFRKVILVQMAVVFVPAGRVVAIMLLKESAVLSIITVPELTHAALRIQAETFQTLPTFALVTLCYWAAVSLVSKAVLAFEPDYPSTGAAKAPLRIPFPAARSAYSR